jgi:Heterokaryon incompatibility protein (HET)
MDTIESCSQPSLVTDQAGEHKRIYDRNELDYSQTAIRVVHLLPGQWDDEIRCELHTVSLDALPIYEALSYVWGNPKTTRTILLDSISFNVTDNLAAALRRLRKQTKKRVIWIDAICINQEDEREKTAQVKKMGIIYENCEQALLWLGEGPNPLPSEIQERPLPWYSDSTEDDLENLMHDPRLAYDVPFAGFLFFYMISRNKHSHETPCLKHDEKGYVIMRLPIIQNGLELIIFSEWWNRIWTVQEAILPKTATLVLGAVMAPLSLLVNAEIACSSHASSGCCNRVMKQSLYSALTVALQKIFRLHSTSLTWQEGSKPFLFDLMWDFRPQTATDDRDKVFGLLGLIPPSSVDSEIAPDYSMTTHELYTKVMLHFLIKNASLSALELCTRNKRGLPSWVIDWSDQPKGRLSSGRRAKRRVIIETYDLSRHNVFIKLLSDELLHLRGFKVGTISSCSEELVLRKKRKPVPTFTDLLNLTGFDLKSNRQCPDGEDSWEEEDAYWRTLCGDVWRVGFDEKGFSVYQRIGPEGRLLYQDWCLFRKGLDVSGNSKKTAVILFHQIVRRMTYERRLFVSTEKYLGLGPLDMRPGDELYLLQGGSVPFVLRKCPPNDALPWNATLSLLPGPRFTFVGNCYVHGIMFGEIYDKKDVVFEDIVLA